MTGSVALDARRTAVAVLASSRPISWINTAYPFGAAYLLAGGGVTVTLVVGLAYFLVPYNLLMYGVNDVFDLESDRRNPRKGGVEGIVLDRGLHRATIVAAIASNVPFLAFLLVAAFRWPALGGPHAVPVTACVLSLVVTVGAVVAYSVPGLRFKERPGLDSVTSSVHFVGPAVIGLAFAGSDFSGSTVCALVAFFLWGAASHAFGAVQDIRADRSASIASVATWLGAARTVTVALVGYLAAAVTVLGTGWPGALAALVPLLYVVNVWPYRGLADADCERANAGWRRFLWLNMVAGFGLTQGFLWVALVA